MIHRAILGSVERFIAILTEHTGGKWPFWISPRQVAVCSISEQHDDFCREVTEKLRNAGFEATADLTRMTINKKVRTN